MKNYFFMAIAMLCLCLTGCNRFKSVETPLTGDFVSFTEQAENGDTLTGVKNIKTGAIIVAQQMIDSIQVLKKAFAVYTSDEKATILPYRLDGTPIDTEDNNFFTFEEKFPYGSENPIYIGHNEYGRVFYFPETGEAVSSTKFYLGIKHIFLEEAYADGHCWSLRTTTGKQTWRFISYEIYLIKDITAKTETFYIGLRNDDKKDVVLYDVNGKELKTISASRWKKAQKQARRSTQIGSATYIECKNVLKL